ncbi:MAG: Mov34/MPN/PAD-1 family protein [Candidatus Binatia bacterium]
MVEIALPREVRERLEAALEAAGKREIGGVIMGKCLAPNRFRVADLTIQKRGGSFASFMRRLGQALAALTRFFQQTGGEYTRFNYLGEWHSHPSFSTAPSEKDVRSMLEIVGDPKVKPNFVALIIVRLGVGGRLEGSATVFWPDGSRELAELTLEGAYE